MRSDTIFVENLLNMPASLISVIDSAINTSFYSGVAWLLIYKDNTTVKGTSMKGYPLSELLNTIAHAANAEALYLSSPPSQLFDDEALLFEKMEQAGITQLHIPRFNGDWWNEINHGETKERNNVQVFEYLSNNIGSQIYYGPYSLLKKNRPWVTCITAANLDGTPIPLSYFENNIAVRLSIKNRVNQSHAIAVELGINAKPFISKINRAKGEISTHDVEWVDDFRQSLKVQFFQKQPTLSLIANKELMEALLKEGLVDEVVYYCILFTEGRKKNEKTKNVNQGFPLLKDWKVTDSNPLSEGVRIIFSRILF